MVTQQLMDAFVQIRAQGLEQVRKQFDTLKQFTAKAKDQLSSTAKQQLGALGSAAGQATDRLTAAAKATGAVGLAGRGLEAARSGLSTLSSFAAKARDQLSATAKSVEVVGSTARRAFMVGTTAAIGFAAAASPGDALRLQAALGRLTVQVGSLFLPVIRTATAFVDRLTGALRQLTPEQREQIGTWAKWGLIVLGAVGAGSKLLSFLPALASGLGAVGSSVKALAALLGIGGAALTGYGAIVLAVVGVLAGLGAVAVIAAGKTDSVGRSFTRAWDGIQKAATAAWAALKPLFATVGSIIAEVASRVGTVIAKITDVGTQVWQQVGKIVREITPVLQQVADAVMDLVDDLMDALEPVATWFAETMVDGLKALLPVIKDVLGGMVNFIRDTIRELRVLGRVLSAIASTPAAALDLEGTTRVARMEVDRTDRERAAKKAADKDADATTPKSKPTQQGVQDVYKPEMSGIADVLRRAQTAALGESREQAMHRERVELQKQSINKQQETTDAVRSLNIGLS